MNHIGNRKMWMSYKTKSYMFISRVYCLTYEKSDMLWISGKSKYELSVNTIKSYENGTCVECKTIGRKTIEDENIVL